MCGIAGVHIKRPGFIKDHSGVEAFVNHLLLGIEARGTHSTGFVATTFGKNRKTQMDKAAVPASEFIKTRDKIPENPQTILLHTRWATKGSVDDHRNNHPVLHKSCFAVHNGHIDNDDELFKEYEMERYGQVDSEAIAAIANKIGLDAPQEFLSKLRGYMATAIIDPVNFPGRLVLAKGRMSPLVAFENEHFLIWASETKALQEAWGHVMGTPPKYNKFKHFVEGQLWVYDDAQKEVATFQVPSYVRTNTTKNKEAEAGMFGYGRSLIENENTRSQGPTQIGRGSMVSVPGSTPVVKPEPSELDETTKRELSVRAIVRAARRGGADWLTCPLMVNMNDATREEVFEMFPELERKLKWVTCPSCDTFVLAPQIIKTLNWGNICKDCQTGNVRYYQAKAKRDAEEQKEQDAKVQWLDPKIEADLKEFLVQELQMHTEALTQVSDEADVDIEIVDWLIFRAPDSYFKERPLMADVAAEFTGMYEEFMELLWEEAKVEPTEAALDYCSNHGNYFERDANCADCALDKAWEDSRNRDRAAAAFPTVGGIGMSQADSTPDMKLCKCGKFTLMDICITCRNKNTNEGLNPTTPPTRPALNPGSPVGENCVDCGSGAEFVVPGTSWAWCVDCFVECGIPTEGVPCTELSNHTQENGVRVCHKHARNCAGIVSDTQLKAKQGEFVELGRY